MGLQQVHSRNGQEHSCAEPLCCERLKVHQLAHAAHTCWLGFPTPRSTQQPRLHSRPSSNRDPRLPKVVPHLSLACLQLSLTCGLDLAAATTLPRALGDGLRLLPLTLPRLLHLAPLLLLQAAGA